MWMSGAPGVGKSAIVQTVCEILGGDDGSQSWLTNWGFGDKCVISRLVRELANLLQRYRCMPLLRTRLR